VAATSTRSRNALASPLKVYPMPRFGGEAGFDWLGGCATPVCRPWLVERGSGPRGALSKVTTAGEMEMEMEMRGPQRTPQVYEARPVVRP